MASSSTARLFLKNGKSFHQLFRNLPLSRPNVNSLKDPQILQSLMNPTTQRLYLQRSVVADGFNFVDFFRANPTFTFGRVEATAVARGRKGVVDDEDEWEDEVDITDADLEELLGSGSESEDSEELEEEEEERNNH